MKMNIFIEGMQGTGKTTLLTGLEKNLPGYKAYREGDISPVELAWCSYMKENEYHNILKTYSHFESDIRMKTVRENEYYITAYTQILTETYEFYQVMESHEIYNGRIEYECFREIIRKRYENLQIEGNIFECSFFQNSIECMLLFYEMSEDEIVTFYMEMYEMLKNKNFFLIYLDSEKYEENIMQVKRERVDENGNEIWYSLMMNYLKESPYGKRHNYKQLPDLIEHFGRRRRLEHRVIREVLGNNCIILPAKEFVIEDVIEKI